jgi:hypothetical protein
VHFEKGKNMDSKELPTKYALNLDDLESFCERALAKACIHQRRFALPEARYLPVKELMQISQRYATETGRLDASSLVIEPLALSLMITVCLNEYYFWMLLRQCARLADVLPIDLGCAEAAIEDIRTRIGLDGLAAYSTNLQLHAPSTIVLLAQHGVVLRLNSGDLIWNPIYRSVDSIK